MLGKQLLLSDLGQTALAGTPWDLHVDTLLMSGVCMTFILVTGSVVANRMVVEGPGGTGQGVVEGLYNFCDDLAHGNIGEHYKTFFPLIASIFIFVLCANLIGIFPGEALRHFIGENWPYMHIGGEKEAWEWASPTTDINVTAGLAAVALLTYLGSGFWKHGAHFAKTLFASPMAPIEMMDMVIRPITLALRLMIVITADELLRGAFLMICPLLLPVGIMGFEIFIGGIQALVFALLTSVYIGLTVAEHH